MSDAFGLLQVIAQIAVAFAGFGTLASVLQRQQGRDDARVDAGRLIHMLIASLATAAMALLPCVLALFALDEDLPWRASAAVTALILVIVTPAVIARSLRMRAHAGFAHATFAVNLAIIGFAFVAFAFCALGYSAAPLPAIYIAGLFGLLVGAGSGFLRVTASLLRPNMPD